MTNNTSCELITKIGDSFDLEQLLKDKKIVNCFLLNIDNFSNVNHAYGYEVGNAVLCQFIKYLDIVKPAESALFRFNADRFILIDERNLNKKDISKIAESILSFFSQTDIIVDQEIEFRLSISIGISTARGLVNISQAEIAIQELRISKKNNYMFFNPYSDFVQKEQENIYWITKIKEAVTNEDIVAYFQPIINNKTQKIEKYECLARLRDEDSIISPYFFMNAAKVTGSLPYVTKALIAQSFKKFSDNEYEFSLNITGEDLIENYLEDFLLKNVNKYKVNPSRVVLELLEDITTLDRGTSLKQLNSLRENGFKVAIDDFGAENSNMSRLLEIHPDYLKIDGAFIKNIVSDEKSQIIVDAIVSICKRSGIKIIAEFIHNKEVQERVKSLGIDYSQGFYFGEPKPDLIELSVSV